MHETGDTAYCVKELVLARSDHLHPAPHQSATAAASVKHWQATTGNKSNVSNKTGAYVSPWWMILLSKQCLLQQTVSREEGKSLKYDYGLSCMVAKTLD